MNKVLLAGPPDARSRDARAGLRQARHRIQRGHHRSTPGSGKERPEYHNIVTWDRLAEICGRYLGKGQQVAIEGRLQTRTWDDEKGASPLEDRDRRDDGQRRCPAARRRTTPPGASADANRGRGHLPAGARNHRSPGGDDYSDLHNRRCLSPKISRLSRRKLHLGGCAFGHRHCALITQRSEIAVIGSYHFHLFNEGETSACNLSRARPRRSRFAPRG